MRAQRRVALNPLEERAAMDTGESSESRRHKVLVVDDDERLLALVRAWP